MMGICYRYANGTDGAKELVNQAYLKTLTNLHYYDSSQLFESWLRTVTVRVCIDDFRRQKNYKAMIELTEHSELNEFQNDFDLNEADKKIEVEHIEQAMQKLPEMSRKVFNLFAIDGFSHQEISEQLGMSVGTSKWHVNQARTKLKELLISMMGSSIPKNYTVGGASLIIIFILYTFKNYIN